MNTDNTILLKVHRQFSKDEGMKVLFQEISRLKFRIGELTSENTELSDTIHRLKNSKNHKPEVIIIRQPLLT